MARMPKFPPTLLHHKGSGQAYVRISGVNRYLGLWDVAKNEASPKAKAAYSRLVAALAAGQIPAPAKAAPATVDDVVAAWWVQDAPRLSNDKERENYRLSLAPLLVLYGPTETAAFDAGCLEVVQLAMGTGSWLTEAQRAAGRISWCAGVVNQRIGRIRTVWRWAERRRLVSSGAWANLRTLPGLVKTDRRVRHAPKRRPATWEEVRDVCRCATPVVRAILLLCWWTGMRPAEAYTMTAGEVDATDNLWVYRPGQHKTAYKDKNRAVVLNRKAQAVLRPWLVGALPDAVLFLPSRRADGHRAPVYNDETFAKAVQRAAKRAGREGVTCYMNRHAAKQRATRLVGLDGARALLGQASIKTTSGYGDAADLELAKEAARRLG